MGGFDAAPGWRSRRRRPTSSSRRAGTALTLSAVILGSAITSCSSDESTADAHIDGAAAVTALVHWAVDELPVVQKSDGEIELPVIYVTAHDGDTMNARLQASVVENTTESATVRFADDRVQAIDGDSDNDAVRDDGVMLIVGELPEPAAMLSIDVEWYESLDDSDVFVAEIRPTDSGAVVVRTRPA